MTNEEAVKVLEDMKVKIAIPKAAELQRKRNEAIDMAIEALSSSEFPNNSDTVSIKAVLDAIDKYDFCYPKYMERFVSEIRDAIKADIKDEIEQLPSAEPPIWAQEVERLYNKALCKPYIKKPFAWALHEVWKMYDKMEVENETD